jgi:hypothetical protein
MPQRAFGDLVPELRLVAVEAFQRACHFVERDPILTGQDREFLKRLMSDKIRQGVNTGEHDMLRLADGAISRARQLAQEKGKLRAAA